MDGPRERDQSVEQLLRQSFEAPQGAAVTNACLDAETLAAWTDGGLSGATLEAAQLHVADCARCQDIVGTLARITSTAPQTEPARASRRWLAWLVPLTAAAAAAALWIALPGNNVRDALVSREPRIQDQAQDKIAEVKPSASAPADNRIQAPRETPVPAPQATETPEARTRRDAPQQQQAVIAADSALKQTASSDRAREKDEVAGNNEAGRLERTEALGKAAAPPAPPPQAPAAATAAPSSPLAARGSLARSAFAAPEVAATEIVSPDPAVRWRILGSAPQRSVNGGSTWEAVSTGVAAELTAGVAPSATVCWLVGRGGVVLLTTDGRTWRRVAFPEMTDLSGVFTVDAGGRVASVSTVDGRTFVTTDGGSTWVSR